MSKNLEQLIGWRVLTDLVTTPQGGVADIWPKEFMTTTTPIEGPDSEIPIIPNSREGLPLTNYGGASKQIDHQQFQTKKVRACHVSAHQTYGPELLMKLNSTDGGMQKFAGQYVAAQVMEFKRRQDNNRKMSLNSVLALGAIYLDGAGNVLPTSSGAVRTVDFGFSANNRNQLNGLITASWATASTPILGNIAMICRQSYENTGRPLRYAYYGSDIVKYMLANTEIAKLFPGSSSTSDALRQGRIPTGFGDPEGRLEWRPLYTSGFKDSGGTFRYWFGADNVVFMPEVDRGWYELQENSYLVPKELTVRSDPSQAFGDFEQVNGMATFCLTQPRPPFGIEHYLVDTWMPVFKDPGSVFIADVVP